MNKEQLKKNLKIALYITVGTGIGFGIATYIYKTKKIPPLKKALLNKMKELEIVETKLKDANNILFLAAGEDIDIYRLQKEQYSELELDLDELDTECILLNRSYMKLK